MLEKIKKLSKAFDSKGKERTRIYLVETKEKLLELWEELTINFKNERIEKNPKGTRIIRTLDDGTEVSLRDYSSKASGNSHTIDTKINDKDYKIHINKEGNNAP